MKFKGTSALLVVFVALGLFVYFTEFRGKEARQQQEEAKKKAIQIDDKNISKISLIYPGLTITGERKGEKHWEITSPAGIEADSDEWEVVASNIPRIEREETVTTDATDLKPFSLDTPLTRVLAKTNDGKTIELLFGSENPRKVSNYAKFADSKEVFLTPSTWSKTFQKTLTDLRNKKILEFEPDDVDAVKIEEARNQIDLQKAGSDWLLKKPIEAKADGGEVNTLASTIRFARAQSFAEPSVDLKTAGLDAPAIRLTLHDNKAKADRILLIGKQPETDKYYARDASREAIFIIDKEIPEKARRPVFNWRDKSIAQVEREKIDEIQIQRGAEKFSFKKVDADWHLPDGRKLKPDSVSGMLNTLEFDKAQDIIDLPGALSSYGLDKPRLEVSFHQGANELLRLSFGADAKNNGSMNLKTSAGPAVKVVSKDVFDKFNVKAEDVVEPKEPKTTTP